MRNLVIGCLFAAVLGGTAWAETAQLAPAAEESVPEVQHPQDWDHDHGGHCSPQVFCDINYCNGYGHWCHVIACDGSVSEFYVSC